MLRERRILVGSGLPDHRSADEKTQDSLLGFRVAQAVNREQGPGLAVYVLAELVGINAGRVVRARRLAIVCRVPRRGPGS